MFSQRPVEKLILSVNEINKTIKNLDDKHIGPKLNLGGRTPEEYKLLFKGRIKTLIDEYLESEVENDIAFVPSLSGLTAVLPDNEAQIQISISSFQAKYKETVGLEMKQADPNTYIAKNTYDLLNFLFQFKLKPPTSAENTASRYNALERYLASRAATPDAVTPTTIQAFVNSLAARSFITPDEKDTLAPRLIESLNLSLSDKNFEESLNLESKKIFSEASHGVHLCKERTVWDALLKSKGSFWQNKLADDKKDFKIEFGNSHGEARSPKIYKMGQMVFSFQLHGKGSYVATAYRISSSRPAQLRPIYSIETACFNYLPAEITVFPFGLNVLQDDPIATQRAFAFSKKYRELKKAADALANCFKKISKGEELKKGEYNNAVTGFRIELHELKISTVRTQGDAEAAMMSQVPTMKKSSSPDPEELKAARLQQEKVILKRIMDADLTEDVKSAKSFTPKTVQELLVKLHYIAVQEAEEGISSEIYLPLFEEFLLSQVVHDLPVDKIDDSIKHFFDELYTTPFDQYDLTLLMYIPKHDAEEALKTLGQKMVGYAKKDIIQPAMLNVRQEEKKDSQVVDLPKEEKRIVPLPTAPIKENDLATKPKGSGLKGILLSEKLVPMETELPPSKENDSGVVTPREEEVKALPIFSPASIEKKSLPSKEKKDHVVTPGNEEKKQTSILSSFSSLFNSKNEKGGYYISPEKAGSMYQCVNSLGKKETNLLLSLNNIDEPNKMKAALLALKIPFDDLRNQISGFNLTLSDQARIKLNNIELIIIIRNFISESSRGLGVLDSLKPDREVNHAKAIISEIEKTDLTSVLAIGNLRKNILEQLDQGMSRKFDDMLDLLLAELNKKENPTIAAKLVV